METKTDVDTSPFLRTKMPKATRLNGPTLGINGKTSARVVLKNWAFWLGSFMLITSKNWSAWTAGSLEHKERLRSLEPILFFLTIKKCQRQALIEHIRHLSDKVYLWVRMCTSLKIPEIKLLRMIREHKLCFQFTAESTPRNAHTLRVNLPILCFNTDTRIYAKLRWSSKLFCNSFLTWKLHHTSFLHPWIWE